MNQFIFHAYGWNEHTTILNNLMEDEDRHKKNPYTRRNSGNWATKQCKFDMKCLKKNFKETKRKKVTISWWEYISVLDVSFEKKERKKKTEKIQRKKNNKNTIIYYELRTKQSKERHNNHTYTYPNTKWIKFIRFISFGLLFFWVSK